MQCEIIAKLIDVCVAVFVLDRKMSADHTREKVTAKVN